MVQTTGAARQASWYHKAHPTFSDALALVHRELWAQGDFLRVAPGSRHGKSPAGVGGTPCRDALQRNVMAKVELLPAEGRR